jgi:hypothetical protein
MKASAGFTACILLVETRLHRTQKGKMFMDEVENNMAVMESAAPEASPPESAPPQEMQIDDRKEKNWREIRRINAELEKKAKAQEELIANLLKQQMSFQNPQASQVDELDSIPDADYIPKGDVKKLLKKEKEEIKKEAREEARRYWEEQEKANFHNRLRSKFSDFDEVVTAETLELLEQQDPDLSSTIAELKDPYKMGLQTYKYIKSLGLSQKAPDHRRTKEVEKKIEQNQKTVQSPQAFEKRPMAQTFQMTEQMKKELWKEMNGYAQMAGGVPNL